MSKANRLTRKAVRKSAWGRRLARARWARPQCRVPHEDTLRQWALDEARGRVLRCGVTFRGDGAVVPWEIRRSVRGRTDQLDIVGGGRVVRTLGRTRLARVFPGALPGVAWVGGE